MSVCFFFERLVLSEIASGSSAGARLLAACGLGGAAGTRDSVSLATGLAAPPALMIGIWLTEVIATLPPPSAFGSPQRSRMCSPTRL